MTDKERLQESPIQPINPFDLPQEEMIEYMHKFNDEFLGSSEKGVPMFKGSGALLQLIRERKVGVGAVVRISYGGSVHRFFMVTSRGFIDYQRPKSPVQSFQEVLDDKGVSGELELDHWYFESHDLIGREEDLWTPEESNL